MSQQALVFATPASSVSLQLAPHVYARLLDECRYTGRPMDDVLVDALGRFFDQNPISLR